MRHPDEIALIKALIGRADFRVHVRDLAAALGIPQKRVTRLCEKWAGQGWYEYGTTADLGWISDTRKALEAALDDGREPPS